jgi:hypothetical protein
MVAARFISLSTLVALAACGSPTVANTNADGPPLGASKSPEATTLKTGETSASADPNGALKGALDFVGTRKLHVAHIDTLMLFADEGLEAQSIVAEWASAVGFTIIDPKLVHRTLQLAAEGKDPTNGEACGPPLDRRWATNRWLAELDSAGHFEAAIYCNPDCSLQLSLQLDSQGTEFYAAAFDSETPWREELHRSLRRLKDNGGHGQHGHLNNPVEVSGSKRSSELGDLVLDQADMRPAPPSLVDKAATCDADRQISQLLVEKTADGALRCEGTDTRNFSSSTTPKAAACLCDALDLKKTTARSVLTIEPPTTKAAVDKTKSGLGLRASIFKQGIYSQDAWTERTFFADCDDDHTCADVGACFVQRSAPLASTRLGVTITYDKEGVATRAAIADFEQLLQADEHACVVKKLMSLRIPCPDAPSSSRKAKLDLEILAVPAKSP